MRRERGGIDGIGRTQILGCDPDSWVPDLPPSD